MPTSFIRFALTALLLTLGLTSHAQIGGATVKTDQVRAELMAHAPQGVQAGQTFWLGLQIAHQPHWHTYWQNPGDSGLPTQLHWTLPAGLTAGDIAWPLPKKIPIGTLANYGYEGTVLLSVPITVGPDFKPPVAGPLKIALQAEWLVCRQECIPQEGQLVFVAFFAFDFSGIGKPQRGLPEQVERDIGQRHVFFFQRRAFAAQLGQLLRQDQGIVALAQQEIVEQLAQPPERVADGRLGQVHLDAGAGDAAPSRAVQLSRLVAGELISAADADHGILITRE